jgi:hypothetical protein
VLPETGVCSTDRSKHGESVCCGSTAEPVSVTLGALARPKVAVQ